MNHDTPSSHQQARDVRPAHGFEEGKRMGREQLHAELSALADAWDRLQLRAYASALRQALAHIRRGEKFTPRATTTANDRAAPNALPGRGKVGR